MPFTFSHPAIVLPLTYLPKKWVSLTGLVIGSLTPDFEYFLRMSIKSNFSHTLEGFFWFDIPLGLLLAFIYHKIVRNSLFENLPKVIKSRFSGFRQFNWNDHFKKNWLVVLVSILVGASSHVLWDGFTHEHGYFVQTLPFLSNTTEIFGKLVPYFKLLQHSSTVIGGLVLVFALYKLPTDNKTTTSIDTMYWVIFAGFTLTIITIRLLTGLNVEQYANLIVTSISAATISLILTALLTRKQKEKSRI